MRFSRRMALSAGGLAAAAVAIGYFAFRKPEKGRSPPEPGTFHRGNAAEPGTLDPALASGFQEDFIMADLLTGLMANGVDARPVPGMALSWTTAADGLSWTFKLREALWSDGTPVTADDFVFAWRRLLDPATGGPYAYFLYVFKNAKAVNAGKLPLTALGVRALDPHTLEVTLEHPAPYLLLMLTHLTMYPLPRHVLAGKGKTWTRPGNYVGNGAYVLKEWVPNEYIALVKNPRFFDAANVAVERVIYYPTDDYGAALRRLRAGELDTQVKWPPDQVPWIRKNMPEITDPVPLLTVEFSVSNLKRPPFDDIRIRTAMNLAINREVITGKITRGGEPPAYNLVPPNVANYPGGNSLGFKSMPYSARVTQAQRLMREAGYGPDRRLKTTYAIRSTAVGAARSIAVMLQQTMALLYIDMAILSFDTPIFYGKIQAFDFDIAQVGWSADFDDAATFLELFLTGGGNNWGQYSNPVFDSMLAVAQKELDLESRGRQLANAEALLLKDQALMPLYFWVCQGLTRPYVKGWAANKMDYNRSRWVSLDEKARAALFAQ